MVASPAASFDVAERQRRRYERGFEPGHMVERRPERRLLPKGGSGPARSAPCEPARPGQPNTGARRLGGLNERYRAAPVCSIHAEGC